MNNRNALLTGLFALSLIASATADENTISNRLIVFGALPSPAMADSLDQQLLLVKDVRQEELLKAASDAAYSTLAYLDIAAVADESSIEAASAIFRSGTPILLKLNSQDPELNKRVSRIFGISGTFGYALFSRESKSTVEVFRLEGYEDDSVMEAARSLLSERSLKRRMTATEEEYIGLPKLTYNINLRSPTREMTSVVNIDVVRSAERSQDKKFISITTSPTTVHSSKNGIVIGGTGGTGLNLWGAYLPHAYRFSHQVTTPTDTPTLVKSAPPSDSRTEFTYSETQATGLAIGGTLGSEFGATRAENISYAAKSPFNVNFGFNYSHSKTTTFTFRDYALLQELGDDPKVTWIAPIDSQLRNVLIRRTTSQLPELTEDRMTPMMRSASFENYSLWELPGSYTGFATVSVGGGYDLGRSEWWWDRTQVRSRRVTDVFNAEETYTLDLNNPFLTREMTVLIRSAEGAGRCLSENLDASVSLQSCMASDTKQLWGFDSESRYVNRATNRCLSVRETDGSMVTARCALDNRQQWEWQADRLHSLYNREWLLYSENNRVKVIPDDSMHFQSTPKNSFNPLNIPWASYPRAPSLHDVMPNHLGPSPQISPEWVERYQGVDTRQRWRIEILRDGI
ncbi:ricin-type beta-trefoil lectin domain protein [Pseudomonas sp. NR3]|uniref:ricin-type beta-trefoil lectin domain protein n=1 Tax=Pseudomonas sp. NR3 TaxID=3155978 RepID=UPI003B67F35D